MNELNFTPLQTRRLNLRPVQDADRSLIYQGLSDPNLTRYMLVHFQTPEESSAQMDYYRLQVSTGSGFYWVMEARERAVGMGVIGFTNISNVHARAEIGFWILPAFQRRGFVREAASALIHEGFGNQGFHRIEASVETGNHASRALLHSVGFTSEGVLRSYEMNRGSRIDLEWFGLLRSEWNN